MMHRALSLWLAVLAVPLVAIAASPSEAGHIGCGAILGPGGSFTLDSNVGPCPPTAPAIRVVSARLDLGGFRVLCSAATVSNGDGIVVQGDGSHLSNGRVEGCAIGVRTQRDPQTGLPASRTIVERVLAAGNREGFHLEGNRARVAFSAARGNLRDGFAVVGDDNQIKQSVAVDNGCGGFAVEGDNNRLTRNTAHRSGCDGFEVRSAPGLVNSRNELEDNVASASVNYGFLVGQATGTKLIGNRAVGNGLDGVKMSSTTSHSVIRHNVLVSNQTGINMAGGTNSDIARNEALLNGVVDMDDQLNNCDANVWSQNVFLTSSQPCID